MVRRRPTPSSEKKIEPADTSPTMQPSDGGPIVRNVDASEPVKRDGLGAERRNGGKETETQGKKDTP